MPPASPPTARGTLSAPPPKRDVSPLSAPNVPQPATPPPPNVPQPATPPPPKRDVSPLLAPIQRQTTLYLDETVPITIKINDVMDLIKEKIETYQTHIPQLLQHTSLTIKQIITRQIRRRTEVLAVTLYKNNKYTSENYILLYDQIYHYRVQNQPTIQPEYTVQAYLNPPETAPKITTQQTQDTTQAPKITIQQTQDTTQDTTQAPKINKLLSFQKVAGIMVLYLYPVFLMFYKYYYNKKRFKTHVYQWYIQYYLVNFVCLLIFYIYRLHSIYSVADDFTISDIIYSVIVAIIFVVIVYQFLWATKTTMEKNSTNLHVDGVFWLCLATIYSVDLLFTSFSN